ncbi:unnamed protein product [Moneuplotes crassus]|uniref:GAF domain-containing protein n=1 Tax=Euplotes crassus TaxID=5936 RepID=A0AAD2D5I2_EUPCR|nr:unnamed protein product [Moneuplotes crassus]
MDSKNQVAESFASTERDIAPMTSKNIDSNYIQNPPLSDIEIKKHKSPKESPKIIPITSVLGGRSKYSTKFPDISRQPNIDSNSHTEDPYTEEDQETEQDLDTNKVSSRKKSTKTKKLTGIQKYFNPDQMNMMNKFLKNTDSALENTKAATLNTKIGHKSPGISAVNNKNMSFQSSNELAKKIKQLEAQAKALDEEYDTLKTDNQELIDQNNYMKDVNKKLFMKMRDNDDLNDTSTDQPEETKCGDTPKTDLKGGMSTNMDFLNQVSVGEVHSMYQDLFLTDMKKEVEDAQEELNQCKKETNSAYREIKKLKKEQTQLQQTLKRYWKSVQEISSEHYTHLKKPEKKNKIDKSNMHKRVETKAGGQFNTLGNQYTLVPGPQRANTQADPFGKMKSHHRLDSRGSASSNNQTNLGSNWIETSKLEKSFRGLNMVNKASTILDTFIVTIKEIATNLVQCKFCNIFCFDPHLSKKIEEEGSLDQSHVQKIMIDTPLMHGGRMPSKGVENNDKITMRSYNRYVDLIGLSDSHMSEPCFKTIEELRYGIRSQQYLAFPVFDKHERIVMAIQLEARSYQMKTRGSKAEVNKKDRAASKYMGFAMVDEHIVKTFCHYIHMKIERMLAKKESQMRERNVVDTLQLISDICTQRTHKGLIMKIKNKLPIFMGFQAAGILIYDKKEDKLLSVAEVNTEEEEEFEETSNLIKFPTNCGITGQVFAQKDADKVNGIPQIEIHSTKDTNNLSEIDNLSNCTEVFNFMIGPIYGEDKTTPIGIIQLFNKKSNEGITQKDRDKFVSIQGLLGMCVDNTTKMSTTMDVLEHFSQNNSLKFVDSKLQKIIEGDPKLSTLENELKEKDKMIKKADKDMKGP